MVKRKIDNGKIENTIWDTFSLQCIEENDDYEIIPEI
jgi:hypothetical protein